MVKGRLGLLRSGVGQNAWVDIIVLLWLIGLIVIQIALIGMDECGWCGDMGDVVGGGIDWEKVDIGCCCTQIWPKLVIDWTTFLITIPSLTSSQ